jgi:hypothetical protein
MSSWPLSDSSVQKKLERAFRNRSIDYSKPGFCDQEAFLRVERQDHRFLETYAQFVEARAYDEPYLSDARQKIDAVAEVMRAAVAQDGRLGACVDASGMVGRMLDRLNIWNYVAKSTLTITFEQSGHDPQYFWALDDRQFVAPHAIVVAPPYAVVDVTVKHQPYPTSKGILIPDLVLADQFEQTNWSAEDLANPTIRHIAIQSGFRQFREFLARRHPEMLEVMAALPARLVRTGDITLKYVIVAIGGFVEPLDHVRGYQPCGKTALELFEQQVVPRLALANGESGTR